MKTTPSNQKRLILVVDDIPVNNKLLRSILEKDGYDVLAACSGKEAYEIAQKEKPYLILLDIMMPEMDGFELCQKLKSDPMTKDIAVIFITAKNTIEDKLKGFEIGGVDFITKPFNKVEVVARVNRHFELKKTQLQLEESKMNYSMLVEKIHDGIFIWNQDDGVIFFNSPLAKMIGHNASTTPMTLEGIILPQDLDRVKKELHDRTVDLQCNSNEISVRLRKKGSDGGLIYTSCAFCSMTFANKLCVLVTVHDMTEQVNLERQLNQSQKLEALGLLTSGIAHDFNNILALINGYTELAMLEIGQDSPLYEKLKIVLDAGRGAVSLTKGLLAFGRIKSIDLRPVNLGDEIQNACNFLKRGLPKTINFNVILPESNIYTLADNGQLHQVLVNLCLNARDAMEKGGDLTIELSSCSLDSLPTHASLDNKPGDYAVVKVQDTGTGISEEDIEKVFNPFYTTKKKGSGLGLPMVERIIRCHHGWLEFESKLNVGTTFLIHIPMVDKEQAEGSTAYEYIHTCKESHNKILVVDDDELQVVMLQEFLSKEGYSVDTCVKSPLAKEMVEQNPDDYGLMIVDYAMPELMGSDLCKQLKSKYPNIKMLLMTGAGETTVAGDQLLRKPFTRHDLLLTLEKI